LRAREHRSLPFRDGRLLRRFQPVHHNLAKPAEARVAVFDFIEGWYNPRRRHSALDYLSPIAYEKRELSQDVTRDAGAVAVGRAGA
jgi:transposase InsO family protein